MMDGMVFMCSFIFRAKINRKKTIQKNQIKNERNKNFEKKNIFGPQFQKENKLIWKKQEFRFYENHIFNTICKKKL